VILRTASEIFAREIKTRSVEYELICGVPYGAISLATGISFETGMPMIFKRKDAKAHGTKKLVEGVYKEGDRCLVVDDVVTSGISILETVEVIDLLWCLFIGKQYYFNCLLYLQSLREHGIKVGDAMVLLDREQGGSENVGNSNVTLHRFVCFRNMGLI